jgi:hypothetical protein
MSYDIIFIRKSDKEFWQEALDAHEQKIISRASQNVPVSEAIRSEWNRIAVMLLARCPEMRRFDTSYNLELTDSKTGIQVSFFKDEVAIAIAYWHFGDKANQIIELAKQLAYVIESGTDLVGFDPQLGHSFLE